MDKVIQFEIMKINRDCNKICKCNPPTYEIDTTNRLIQCTTCGAYVEPFEAILKLSEYGEYLHKEIERLKEKRNLYAKEVNELGSKRFKLNHFRNLQSSYLQGLSPICPKCNKPFDIMKITSHTSNKYIENEEE